MSVIDQNSLVGFLKGVERLQSAKGSRLFSSALQSGAVQDAIYPVTVEKLKEAFNNPTRDYDNQDLVALTRLVMILKHVSDPSSGAENIDLGERSNSRLALKNAALRDDAGSLLDRQHGFEVELDADGKLTEKGAAKIIREIKKQLTSFCNDGSIPFQKKNGTVLPDETETLNRQTMADVFLMFSVRSSSPASSQIYKMFSDDIRKDIKK